MSSNLTEPGSAGLRLRKQQQPAIWSSGRQAPRFDAGIFLSATTNRSLRLASRGLGAAGTLARRSADALGQAPADRDKRPSRTRYALSRTAGNTARLVELARDRIAERLPQPAPVAQSKPVHAVAAGSLRIVRPARARAHHSDADADIMQAIRSVVHMANVAPARPTRLPPTPEPAVPERRALRLPALAPAEPLPPGPMLRNAAVALAAVMVALTWPVAATQSLFAHLRGEDLRQS